MAHEDKLNQEITDTELNPAVVLQEKNIQHNGQWDADGKFYFEVIDGTTISQSQYDTWKAEKTLTEWKTLKDSRDKWQS